ncbi:MAG: CRTAC1 family protein, partial [Acidobacteria bacterium]|nr:CRTAC1 family protein [Acidobacteriota bacterium]
TGMTRGSRIATFVDGFRPAGAGSVLVSVTLAAAAPPTVPQPKPEPAAFFVDASTEAGIQFRQLDGGSGRKYMVETMGSGVCWFDADGDSWADLYLLNGQPLPGHNGRGDFRSRFYRNRGDGTFADATERSGLADPGYGMGCTAADVDGDGDLDLYVTAFGPNRLYLNQGDGRFEEVGAAWGVDDGRWGASAAFADYDGDGDMDLYVSNYVDFTIENHKYCGKRKPGYQAYCHPDVYNGVTDLLYRNDGGHFTDVTRAAGVFNPGGNGLGVVWGDYDNDGDPDLYIANDKTANFLYRNNGDGTFAEVALLSGVGYGVNGQAQASMGVDFGDYDGDGDLDLVVTNFDVENNNLYRNNGNGTFSDVALSTGVGDYSYLVVGFGAEFLDYDNDADLDLIVVNGHIIDNIELYRDILTYEQRNLYLENDGKGKFTDRTAVLGSDLQPERVSRGLAVADYDHDGDLDLLVSRCNQEASLYRNERGNERTWLVLDLRSPGPNRFAVGARVEVRSGGKLQIEEVRTGTSYLSQSDLRLHFGLNGLPQADSVRVRWPSGRVQDLGRLEAGHAHLVEEPSTP